MQYVITTAVGAMVLVGAFLAATVLALVWTGLADTIRDAGIRRAEECATLLIPAAFLTAYFVGQFALAWWVAR